MHFSLIPKMGLRDLLYAGTPQEAFGWAADRLYFSHGRIALLNGARLLARLKPAKRNILVPAYICEETLWPLRAAGFGLDYYEIDDDLKANTAQLQELISADTLAVMAVHYFGIPQELEKIRELCDRTGVFLIEDCAHALGGRAIHGPLGSSGDISIFSMRKFLPVPDGGALVINNPRLSAATEEIKLAAKKESAGFIKLLASSALNEMENRWGICIRSLIKRESNKNNIEDLCPRPDLAGIKKGFIDNKGMSSRARRMFVGYDIERMSAQRRANYNIMAEKLLGLNGIKVPGPEITAGGSPYVLPVCAANHPHQLAIIRALIKEGKYVTDWPTLPIDLNDQKLQGAECLRNRIILLPVHQNLPESVAARIIQTIKEARI